MKHEQEIRQLLAKLTLRVSEIEKILRTHEAQGEHDLAKVYYNKIRRMRSAIYVISYVLGELPDLNDDNLSAII